MNNWLDKYEQGGMVLKQKTKDNYGKKANPNNPDVSLPPGFKGLAYNTQGRNYSPAWGGQFQMGGSLPGAVGFTYARTAGAAPSNGPYAKKTKASAQNGKEVEYKELPEIVVVGGKDKSTIDLYRNELDKLQSSENNPYSGAAQFANYYAKMQMAKEFGVPKVRPAEPIGKIESFFRNRSGIKSDSTEPQPQYSPFTKTVYAGFDNDQEYKKQYIPELSHYVSQTKRKEYLGKDDYNKAALSMLWEYVKGNNPYNVEGTEENFAHRQLEPALLESYKEFKDIGRKMFMDAGDNSVKRKIYEKNTKLQNGGEMKYYQEGLDFKPKTISQDGSEIPVDPMGYWNPENIGNPVIIPSNEITMEGVDQPLIGISDTGDVQYMYPGEDYTFDGESVTEYPIAQKGISVPAPTTADSLKLFNAQIALNDFYNKEIKEGRLKRKSKMPFYGFENPGNFRDENLYFYRKQIDDRKRSKGSGFYDKDYKTFFNFSPEQVRQLELKGLGQTKSGNQYQQYYRDRITPMQNLAAPFALIDTRVEPQGELHYEPPGGVEVSDYPGGAVSVYEYDPLAIKPYNMRTPKEKEDWKKKYGKPEPKPVAKSTPKKEQPTKQVKKPQPKQEVVKKQEPAIQKEQPKPIERKQNVYEGSPVYSPGAGIGMGSALVGFLGKQGDTTYIKPEDYERFAVPKYGKEFIESRKKQRNGGVNKADEYPIEKLDQSLNFTNYNKPTKGGWLDRYEN